MFLDPMQDGISGVQLLDVMGTDLTVVNAARVSMNKESDWEGDYDLPQADAKLISYLARHNHWTPFSHPQISLRIKMPIFIARQWFKHQIGFTRNEVSRRYVSESPEFHLTDKWRARAPSVKQGSSDELVDSVWMTNNVEGWASTPDKLAQGLHELSRQVYEAFLNAGICPEQARMVLPQSMYTEFIETGSLAAYARLAKLRLDPHAQREVRLYAEAVTALIEPHFPDSWKALTC